MAAGAAGRRQGAKPREGLESGAVPLRRRAAEEEYPYAIFQRWRDGKNQCERIPKDELPAISRAVDGYRRFTRLADEYVALTEILTQRRGPVLPSEKNSRKQPPKKSSRKPKPSSKPSSGG